MRSRHRQSMEGGADPFNLVVSQVDHAHTCTELKSGIWAHVVANTYSPIHDHALCI